VAKDFFTKLNRTQLKQKLKFIEHYKNAKNSADGSILDSNANVSSKNIATLDVEMWKDLNIQMNREMMYVKIKELFAFQSDIPSGDLADEYIRQLDNHEIYAHDETNIRPYCLSASCYTFLSDGMRPLGGPSSAPKKLSSFCGSFVNLVFALSSQVAGAVGTPEFLMYFNYFAEIEFGSNYLEEKKYEIDQYLQQVVYSMNQPSGQRGFQSVFWNVSVFDKNYFESIFESFSFPDATFTRPNWETLNKLQNYFLDWLRIEREKELLTFPVTTVAMLTKDGEPEDVEFARNRASDLALGARFFVYMSDSADSLASCCRLRNEVSDNTFSHTLGAGGVATGSINVITLNLNRIIQNGQDLAEQVRKVHKYQVAYKSLIQDYQKAGLLPIYDIGFVTLDKQFLTIGVNGLVEAAESKGIRAGNNPEYKKFCADILKTITEENKKAKKKYGHMFNTEFVPAENLGVKNANWDKKDGYKVSRDAYNSYFYPVESDSINVLDKFILHGEELNQFLDGGSALHLNLQEHLDEEGYYNLFKIAAKTGCNYFCTNIDTTICNECETIDVRTLQECPKCGSTDLDFATRIIGFLRRISSFSSPRQVESKERHYHED